MSDKPETPSVYELAYKREKAARKEAEQLLESKTHELFSINEILKEQYALLQKQQKGLVKTEKLAAIGQLSAGIAHEINNPLSYVISNVRALDKNIQKLSALGDLYSDDSLMAEQANQYLKKEQFEFIFEDNSEIFTELKEGLDRVKDIVANMRRFSRTQPGDRELTDVNEAISSALKICHSKLRNKCTLTTDLHELPKTYCNPNELIQVFMNLLINASQAVEQDGNIWIHSSHDHSSIKVSVRDDGAGIDESIRERIFDPFFTAKPIGEGTGLGLSVSYGLIKDLGGIIEVQSKVGEGSEFTVTLPVDQRD